MSAIETLAVRMWDVNNALGDEFGQVPSDWNTTGKELRGMQRLLTQQQRFDDSETAEFLSSIAFSIEAALINQEHDEDFDDYNDTRMQK